MEVLDDLQARVLACLVEKQITTPEYYPMTLKALTNACNQKSNRNPVMALEEQEVALALDRLREQRLAFRVKSDAFRAPKYEHAMEKVLDLDAVQTAVLCELLLRGPQTPGELRARASRMLDLNSNMVAQALEGMENREQGALVIRLPRATGQKERRYAHLLCGKPDVEAMGYAHKNTLQNPPAQQEKLQALEHELEKMKTELEELKAQFLAFKAQFD